MPKLTPQNIANLYPNLSLAERKQLLESNQHKTIKMFVMLAAHHLKEAYSIRYEKCFGKRCIWRWMGRNDHHWREMARGLIRCEVDFEEFMDWVWRYKPRGAKHPVLSWMKSTLVIEQFLAHNPDADEENAVPWHLSRDYNRQLQKAQKREALAERCEGGPVDDA